MNTLNPLNDELPLNSLDDSIICYELQTGQSTFRVGVIDLNRPEKINAINSNMIELMMHQLKRWSFDLEVGLIIFLGIGQKGYCAGGDVKACFAQEQALEFFENEYKFDEYLMSYPKPVVHLLHGYVMGGGMGLMVHGDFRMADEYARFAMPEGRIGFFPDVGMAHVLAYLPKGLGAWLGMTGASISAFQAADLGLIDAVDTSGHFYKRQKAAFDLLKNWTADKNVCHKEWPAQCLTDLKTALCQSMYSVDFSTQSTISEGILNWCEDFWSNPVSFDHFQSLIERVPGLISDCLDEKQAFNFHESSPLSCVITYFWLRKAGVISQKKVFEGDLRLAQLCLDQGDFQEGVQALLVDKRQPQWRYQSFQDAYNYLKGSWLVQ